jgi:superfamily II DNA or RNA helicase
MPELKNISPNELTKFVSFFRDRDGFEMEYAQYNKDSMQAKQAEGSSYLFNLLNEKGIALLADEVGMGKTIQSLAVCAALWQQKPDAQILVLAPRNEIAFNWEREYETFINVHYKVSDDIVKSKIGNQAINPTIFCSNLYDLVHEVNQKWGRFFVGKISSFSGLLSKDDINDRLSKVGINTDEVFDIENGRQTVRRIAELMRKQLQKELKSGRFDLIIIDESHYFRNKNGESLRVNVAEEIFGKGEDRLADRVLLLTATPNHSSSDNIRSIVSYFTEKYNNSNYSEILNDICLRRFRRLSSKGKIKYNYRREIPMQADFKDEMAELFFGVYQKQLVQDYMQGKKQGSRRNILGFLEGTEFIPHHPPVQTSEEELELRDGQDFTKGSDSKILLNLSAKYKEIFDQYPSHPKYDLIVNNLIKSDHTFKVPNDKKLVFVRRIPSVREIAARVNHRYDEILLDKISKAIGRELKLVESDFRTYYENQIKAVLSNAEREEEEDLTQEAEVVGDSIQIVPTSKVMDLFKTLKKTDSTIRSTHASNFRLRFTRSKLVVFNVFFAPAADYLEAEYNIRVRRTEQKGKGILDDHYLSCLHKRVETAKNQGVSIQIQSLLGGREFTTTTFKDEQFYRIPTLLTIFWEYMRESGNSEYQELLNIYKDLNLFQREAFSAFIEKGILLASTALVDLYIAFINASKDSTLKGYDLYIAFAEQVRNSLSESSIPEIISSSLRNFKVLCEKVFNITKHDDLLKEEWKNFHDAQPAYAYSGDTKNQRIMTSFNTPFFPDVLISTSVLQEGVNLQYFCDKIIHYGIAWTPGDNEQRVGRIDRMFSLTERKLEKDESNCLEIAYPYLRNTIDQDHLANFIIKKYREETLIDKCQAFSGKTILDPENFNPENWQEYFRVPQQFPADDPYKVKPESLRSPTFELQVDSQQDSIIDRIIETFQNEGIATYEPKDKSALVCVLDDELEERNNRKQPVFIEVKYEPKGTGKVNYVAYRLTMRTPLGTKRQIKLFEDHYKSYRDLDLKNALTCKLCFDASQPLNSIWGIYMKVELPIFTKHPDDPLSMMELLNNYRQLMNYADFVEQRVTGGDIQLSDEGTQVDVLKSQFGSGLRKNTQSFSLRNGWNIEGNFVCYKVGENPFLSLREMWAYHHLYPFYKCVGDQIVIPYQGLDIQSVEFDFLESYL